MNIRFSAITPADLRVKGNVIGHANRKQPGGNKTLYEITDLPLRPGAGHKPKVAIYCHRGDGDYEHTNNLWDWPPIAFVGQTEKDLKDDRYDVVSPDELAQMGFRFVNKAWQLPTKR